MLSRDMLSQDLLVALLRLRERNCAQATWLELAVQARVSEWGGHFPLTPSADEATMRGRDPLLAWPVRQRCDSLRDWCARVMAFAVPNRAALDSVVRHVAAGGVLELGAGTGYWARALLECGAHSWHSRWSTFQVLQLTVLFVL